MTYVVIVFVYVTCFDAAIALCLCFLLFGAVVVIAVVDI
jgi:hypothetical protein